jgi:hypothetical protein
MPYAVRGRASIGQPDFRLRRGNHLAEPWTKIHPHARKRFWTEQKSLNRSTPLRKISPIASITTLLPANSAPVRNAG